MMANLLDREWRTTEGFPARRVSGATRVALAPTRGQTTRQPHRRSSLDPGGGRRRSREILSKGSDQTVDRTKVLHGPQTYTCGIISGLWQPSGYYAEPKLIPSKR